MYSQRDPRWANIKLGFGNTTIGSHGCFLTSLAWLAGITPDKANEILKKAGAFNKDLIISDKAAKALNLEYYAPPRSPDFNCSHTCIAEVDFSPKTGKQQHFVVYEPDGTQLDPWTGGVSNYPIISIRVFKNTIIKETKMEFKKSLEEIAHKVGFDYGENINENEAEKLVEKIDQIMKDLKDLEDLCQEQVNFIREKNEIIDKLKNEINSLKNEIEIQKETIESLEKNLEPPVRQFELFGFTFKLYKL